MKILGLIPAREGSRGVPGKHMKLLGGKPLIDYTFQSALQARLLSKIALSTDSADIIDFTKSFSRIEVPFKRPADLATDETPTISVILHALHHYRSAGEHFDLVCLLQPTTPFRAEGLVDRVITSLLESGAEGAVTVRKVPEKYHPNWSFEINTTNNLINSPKEGTIISRRQDLPPAYHRDGQIYIATTESIEQGILVGQNTRAYINEKGPDINIDNAPDWQMAENWLIHDRG